VVVHQQLANAAHNLRARPPRRLPLTEGKSLAEGVSKRRDGSARQVHALVMPRLSDEIKEFVESWRQLGN
jgi:hypothetical protein